MNSNGKRTLVLRLSNGGKDQSLAINPCQIDIAVSFFKRLHNLEVADLGDGLQWESRRSTYNVRRANDFLNYMQDIVIGNKTLINSVALDSTYYWQFLPSYIWPQVFFSIEMVTLLNDLIKEVKPEHLLVFPATSQLRDIWQGSVEAAADQYGLKISFVKETSHGFLKKSRFFAFLKEVGFFLKKRWKLKISNYQVKNKASTELNARENHKLLFLSTARYWVRDELSETGKVDEQFDDILKALEKTGWNEFVGIDSPYEPQNLASLHERRESSNSRLRWEAFYSYGVISWLEFLKAHLYFSSLWRKLRKDRCFFESMKVEDIFLLPALESTLKRAFKSTLPECYEMVRVAGKILEVESPEAVLLTYETGPFARAIIVAAAKRKIPTVGLMHGMIFADHYDYMHKRISPALRNGFEGFAVPNVTCVWGDAWKDVLTKDAYYPEDSVRVTGNWRYDRLFQSEIQGISELRSGLGLDASNKLILILSSDQETPSFLETVLSDVKSMEGLIPLVGLHPREDLQVAREVLCRHGFSPDRHLLIGKRFQALVAADVVISQWSTILSEAALLDKPLILVDFVGLVDPQHVYRQQDFCVYVSDPAHLEMALCSVLNNESEETRRSQNRRLFAARYFGEQRGFSATKVASLVNELCGAQSL